MRWALGVSAVLNSILIMTVTGALPFFFFLSLTVNIALFWYVFSSFRQYQELEEDISNMLLKTFELEEHLVSVYQMEMFYGDQTLQSLMDHARSFREYMDEFDYIYIPEEEQEDAETPEIEQV